MKPYLALLKCRILSLFQYRAAALAGLVTQIFWGLVKMMILTAFFAETTAPQPISLQQAIVFIWLGQALLQLVPWSIDKEIEALVKSGNVAYELVRPLDLYWHWFFRAMAMRIVPTFIRCIPLVIVASFFQWLPPPVSISSGVAFSASLILSILLTTSITTLIIISIFWTISGEGILRLLPHTAMVLSGLMIPLPLFPAWMQTFLSLQPFRGVIDIPSRLYTGVIPSHEALYFLAFQLIWSIALIGLGRWMMSIATKRIVIQGG
jgi:ABC-2 type transport system permease protein